MTAPIVHNTAEATRAVEANTTPRMRHLALLRAYVAGTQYDSRPKWHDKSVPVWEREPAIIWMAAQGAITSNEDLLLGEGRYPAVTTAPEEDNGDDDEALDEEPSEELDRFIRSVERESKLRAHTREQYANAQSVGTAVGIFGARKGRLFAECANAEFCTAELDVDDTVLRLEIRYPYVDVSWDDSLKQWRARALIYRRVIDDKRDVTFLPGVATADCIEPVWREDPKRSGPHGLGFCPVIWHRFRSVARLTSEEDGHAIHEQLRDEIDAYCVQASMRHEGAVYSLPQRYETGVDPGYNPTGTIDVGRVMAASAKGGVVNPIDNPATGLYREAVPASALPNGARKQGPGYTWQYANPESKVGQLEAGDLTSLAETMAELRARICETLAWVPLNPEDVKFAASLSGKALERIMARQINRVAKDRDGFGEGYMLRAYSMLLRIAQRVGAGLKTRGITEALPLLATFLDGVDWADPPLELRWGAWFQPIPEDDEKLVSMTKASYDAKFITLRTAVEKLSRTFNIENVDAYLESLEEEREQRQEEEILVLNKGIDAMHAGLDDDATGTHAAGREGDAKANPRSGGDRASAPAKAKAKARGGRNRPSKR